jgi:hypothetical protein
MLIVATRTAKFSTEESINILIPAGSPEYEKMRLVFHQLLFSEEGELILVENGFPFKSENWPTHIFTDAELNEIFSACKKAGKLEEWTVTAYIASLVQARGTPHEKSAYQWSYANAYILMGLAQLEKHENYRVELCARFRLAHPRVYSRILTFGHYVPKPFRHKMLKHFTRGLIRPTKAATICWQIVPIRIFIFNAIYSKWSLFPQINNGCLKHLTSLIKFSLIRFL